jgi:enediyne biosynthesis protein E4
MKEQAHKLIRTLALGLLLSSTAPQTQSSQQPDQSQEKPAQTGRSYGTGDPSRKPPAPPPQSPSPIAFTDSTAISGITFRHFASPTSQKYLLEAMGGGVAMFDYDNDGRLDLFFANGAWLDDPMPKNAAPDKDAPEYWDRLYRQKADGTFEDVTAKSGLRGRSYSMGVAVGDYDNDGWADIFVGGYGAGHLYRNSGNGSFEETSIKSGVIARGWTTSAAFLDYDRDGRLDLFVARYLDWDFEKGKVYCGERREGYRAYCHPDNFDGVSNLLFHQRADGSFEDVSQRAGIASAIGKGLGVSVADFDDDGWPDIFVANDSIMQFLFHNLKNGTFEETALLAGAAYDENGKPFAGMGVDAADYDNDGKVDVLITALSNETYPLFRGNGDVSFTHVTASAGVGQSTLLYSGWGARMVDLDNDGLRDIFVAQGHVLDTIEKNFSYLKYRQPPLFLRQTPSHKFVNVSASAGEPFNIPLAARGAASGDLDNDGDTDLAINTLNGPPVIMRNNGTKNHWIGLSLRGKKSNRLGLGARVSVVDDRGALTVFEVTTSSSYLSASDPRIIAGLGAASFSTLQIQWPSGVTQRISNLPVDRYHQIEEP